MREVNTEGLTWAAEPDDRQEQLSLYVIATGAANSTIRSSIPSKRHHSHAKLHAMNNIEY